MNLIKYVIDKWDKDAERVDKVKVTFLTLFNAGLAAIFSTQGVVSLFNIKDNLFAICIVVAFFVHYFHVFRLWHIGRILIGISPEDAKKNAKT